MWDYENCINHGVDDDLDFGEDCADPKCADHPACKVLELCDNYGYDDDGDGLADCADPECSSHSSCATTSTSSSGGGQSS